LLVAKNHVKILPRLNELGGHPPIELYELERKVRELKEFRYVTFNV